MKHSNLLILFIGLAIIFSGCSKDNSLTTDLDQSDQITNSMKADKISFTGTSIPDGFPVGGDTTYLPNGKVLIKGVTADWYDHSDSCGGMITGPSFWTVNSLTNPDGSAKMWGKAEITVDGEGCTGKWEISWHGYLTPYTDGSGIEIICDGNGKGKEGDVKGMVGKWTYTMNFVFSDPTTFFYASEGYIK